MAQEKVKVVIYVEGGVVQHVECGDFVEVEIIDYDNESEEISGDEYAARCVCNPEGWEDSEFAS